jgi:hypothetical protein
LFTVTHRRLYQQEEFSDGFHVRIPVLPVLHRHFRHQSNFAIGNDDE